MKRIALVLTCTLLATTPGKAADIIMPGVLDEPETATANDKRERKTESATPKATWIAIDTEGYWASGIMTTPTAVGTESPPRQCTAMTPSYDPATDLPEFVSNNQTGVYGGKFVAALAIAYTRDEPDKAGVQVDITDHLIAGGLSTLQIGTNKFVLDNAREHSAQITTRRQRIALIDAIRRGRTAKFSSRSPDGTLVERTFSLMGATAMTNGAARACLTDSANPGAPKPRPTPVAKRKKSTQPIQQARTQPNTTQHADDPGCIPGMDPSTGMAIMEEAVANDDLLGGFIGGMMLGLPDC